MASHANTTRHMRRIPYQRHCHVYPLLPTHPPTHPELTPPSSPLSGGKDSPTCESEYWDDDTEEECGLFDLPYKDINPYVFEVSGGCSIKWYQRQYLLGGSDRIGSDRIGSDRRPLLCRHHTYATRTRPARCLMFDV